MDPEKTKVLVDWPTPDSRKQLQLFLGFAKFYQCFIRGQLSYSSSRPANWLSSGHQRQRCGTKNFTLVLIFPGNSALQHETMTWGIGSC